MQHISAALLRLHRLLPRPSMSSRRCEHEQFTLHPGLLTSCDADRMVIYRPVVRLPMGQSTKRKAQLDSESCFCIRIGPLASLLMAQYTIRCWLDRSSCFWNLDKFHWCMGNGVSTCKSIVTIPYAQYHEQKKRLAFMAGYRSCTQVLCSPVRNRCFGAPTENCANTWCINAGLGLSAWTLERTFC